MITPLQLQTFLDAQAELHPTSFVAPNATLIGHVHLAEEASVWFQSVLRADLNAIRVGPHSNIQDGAIVHLADDFPTEIGEWVTVGHKAILHACKIQDEVLVGMNAVILDGAEIGSGSIVGAGSLVTSGKKFAPGSLILGSPAKVVKTLSIEEQRAIRPWAAKYVALSKAYLERGIGAQRHSGSVIWPPQQC
jgi:carbonic anhydrase/acetyltransferase-like protein (isoleucine patch superfamily)